MLGVSNRFIKRLRALASRVLDSPLVISFSKKYPRLNNFLLDRISLNKFTGLPTTILFCLLATNLFLRTELAENITESEAIRWLDDTTRKKASLVQSDWLDKGLYAFTFLASTISINIIAGVTSLYLIFKRQYILIVGLVTSWVGAGFTSWIAKIFFRRARPLKDVYYVEDSYSFPSGHATLTIAVYGFLFYIFVYKNKSIKSKKIWWGVLALFILAMGFSRIYLGVHFFSDVLGGYILGFIWPLMAIAVVEYKAQTNLFY